MRNREYEQTYHRSGEIVTLPGLNMEHEVPSGVLLKDLGEVDSLKESFVMENLRLRGIIRERRTLIDRVLGGFLDSFVISNAQDVFEENHPGTDTSLGGCCEVATINQTTRAYALAVRKGLSKSDELFAQAHEEGEYLQKVYRGKDDLFAELYRRGIRLNYDHPYDSEMIADMAGLLALRNAANSGVEGITVPSDFINPRPWLMELQGYFGF